MSDGEPAPVVPAHARFPLVDSVRAFAALTIFGFHISFHLGLLTQDTLSRYLGNLNVGVPVFFVVSGFLLYRPFVASRLGGRPAPPLVPYAIRRALRIVPAYWVALPIVVIMLGEQAEVFTPRGIVTYFGFLQIYDANTVIGGIGQAWTLCIEVTFYAALPLWALGARRLLPRGDGVGTVVRWELVALAGLFAFSVAWKLVFQNVLTPADPGFIPAQITLPAFADQFALGMALAVVSAAIASGMRTPRALRLIELRPWIPLAGAAACFALLGVKFGGFGQNWADAGIVRHELKAIIGVLVLMPAVFGAALGGRIRSVMAWRPLLLLGLISYSFYLWHLALILKLKDVAFLADLGWGAVALAAFAATVAVAALSYRFVEAPGMRLGRRWARAAAKPAGSR